MIISEQEATILAQAQEIINNHSINNKTIYIEDTSGALIMAFKLNEQGLIIKMDNCKVINSNETENRIILQQIREVK